MPVPITDEEWLKNSGQFEELWIMSHAVGALVKKTHSIECPKLSGSLYQTSFHLKHQKLQKHFILSIW